MSKPSGEMPESLREELGILVHKVWTNWAEVQPDASDLRPMPWHEMEERYRELGREIGSVAFDFGRVTGLHADEVLEYERLLLVEELASHLFIAVWHSIQRGAIDERSQVSDAALKLRDALNPDWPANPNWLPDELQ
jgi:hypothetical protein